MTYIYSLIAKSYRKSVIGSIYIVNGKYELLVNELDGNMKPLPDHVGTCDRYDSLNEALQAFDVRTNGSIHVTVTNTYGETISLIELLYKFDLPSEIC